MSHRSTMNRRQFLQTGCFVGAGLTLAQGCGDRSTNPQFPVTIAKAACTGCGVCVAFCPHQAISLVASGGTGSSTFTALIDQNLCTKCLTCLPVCAYDAILFQEF